MAEESCPSLKASHESSIEREHHLRPHRSPEGQYHAPASGQARCRQNPLPPRQLPAGPKVRCCPLDGTFMGSFQRGATLLSHVLSATFASARWQFRAARNAMCMETRHALVSLSLPKRHLGGATLSAPSAPKRKSLRSRVWKFQPQSLCRRLNPSAEDFARFNCGGIWERARRFPASPLVSDPSWQIRSRQLGKLRLLQADWQSHMIARLHDCNQADQAIR